MDPDVFRTYSTVRRLKYDAEAAGFGTPQPLSDAVAAAERLEAEAPTKLDASAAREAAVVALVDAASGGNRGDAAKALTKAHEAAEAAVRADAEADIYAEAVTLAGRRVNSAASQTADELVIKHLRPKVEAAAQRLAELAEIVPARADFGDAAAFRASPEVGDAWREANDIATTIEAARMIRRSLSTSGLRGTAVPKSADHVEVFRCEVFSSSRWTDAEWKAIEGTAGFYLEAVRREGAEVVWMPTAAEQVARAQELAPAPRQKVASW